MRASVKAFYDGLNEMRKIYPFKDENTIMGTENSMSRDDNRLAIHTVDEGTGIMITMEKIVGSDERFFLERRSVNE